MVDPTCRRRVNSYCALCIAKCSFVASSQPICSQMGSGSPLGRVLRSDDKRAPARRGLSRTAPRPGRVCRVGLQLPKAAVFDHGVEPDSRGGAPDHGTIQTTGGLPFNWAGLRLYASAATA
jgi:hypothetical protein